MEIVLHILTVWFSEWDAGPVGRIELHLEPYNYIIVVCISKNEYVYNNLSYLIRSHQIEVPLYFWWQVSTIRCNMCVCNRGERQFCYKDAPGFESTVSSVVDVLWRKCTKVLKPFFQPPVSTEFAISISSGKCKCIIQVFAKCEQFINGNKQQNVDIMSWHICTHTMRQIKKYSGAETYRLVFCIWRV